MLHWLEIALLVDVNLDYQKLIENESKLAVLDDGVITKNVLFMYKI